jgi:hypothetical protein
MTSAFSSEATGALFGERSRLGLWITAGLLAGTGLALALGATRDRRAD